MASPCFNLALAASDGVTVLPDVIPPPAVNQVLTVKQLDGGNVLTGFIDPAAAGGGPFLPLNGSAPMTGSLVLPNGSLAAPSLAVGAVDGSGISRAGAALSIGVQGTMTLGLFAGSAQFYGPLSLLDNKLVQVADPTAATDALNLRTADARYLSLAGGILSGGLTIGSGASAATTITQSATNVQPTVDHIYNTFQNVVSYTANGTNGDSLGIVSYMGVRANGHAVPATASQHTTAIYGNGYLDADGNAASLVDRVSGLMGVAGNSGPGTLTNAIAVYGHPNYNTGGGHITNHYFLFEEPSSAAQNHYNYVSAPLGIGITAPQYNIDINMQGGGNVNFNNGLRIDFNAPGSLLVARSGMSLYPGYNPGPGGFGCTDMVVGYNGAPNATNATTSFLYISACPGSPTAGPALAAPGRVALTYDTVNHKLWVNDGSGWRGVVLS